MVVDVVVEDVIMVVESNKKENKTHALNLKGDDIMMRKPLYGMRCEYVGRGFAAGRSGAGRGMGRGLGMGLGPNFSNYCRFEPTRPSRRAMFLNGQFDQSDIPSEAEILKSQAEYLKSELDTINKQLEEIENRD